MVGLLITAFGIARFLIDIPAGRLADRLGRRPVLLTGPIIQIIGSVGCGFAVDFWQLVGFRFLQGIGSAVFTTPAMVMVMDISTPSNRGHSMSIYQGSLLLGAGLGPVLGGFAAEYWGLRVPFFIFAVCAFIAGVWALLRMRETRPESQSAAVRPGHSRGINPFSGSQMRPFLNNVHFLLISTITIGIFFMRTGGQNQLLPLLAHDRIGSTEKQIGIALTVVAIVKLICILLSGRLSDRFGRKAIITPGCIIAAGYLVILSYSYSYSLLLLASVAMGMGIGFSGSTSSAYVADIIPKKNYGAGMGLYRAIADLGFVTGPVLLGLLADNFGYSFSLLFNSVFLFLGAVIFHAMAKEPSRLLKETTGV